MRGDPVNHVYIRDKIFGVSNRWPVDEYMDVYFRAWQYLINWSRYYRKTGESRVLS